MVETTMVPRIERIGKTQVPPARAPSVPPFLLLLAIVVACCTPESARPRPRQIEAPTGLAIVARKIYTSPDAPPIVDGVILVDRGRISRVGDRKEVAIAPGTRTIDAVAVTAGFWNCHVHFTEPAWERAGERPAAELGERLREMLTRRGFVAVVDTGSLLSNTLTLRRRIESDELSGPAILTAGGPLYPKGGVPYYLRDTLPPDIVKLLAQPASATEATALVKKQIAEGADIVKLFTGSWIERGKVLLMAPEVAAAAVAEAHREGRLVFSHASNLRGLEIALEAGVDVIAHALDDDRGLTPAHFARMHASHTAMIPTLKLFSHQPFTKYVVAEVSAFARSGGEILFGTDVGYLTDYDATDEFVLLSSAGLSTTDILAALTTAPAARFGSQGRRGRVAQGDDADLVILGGDPASDVRAFADVRITIRAGKTL
jgi:imidazolonepropionase-like amidohydrolase